jgi:pSer/pThr/pTyr-binding forkhead associated (FHA) protein/tetratricopeptide (TPR) repeat protein
MSAALRLVILRDGRELQALSLDRELSVGRGEACAVRLQDQKISRSHLVLVPGAGGVRLEGKSRFSPIRVNGVETDAAQLKAGDCVEVGPFQLRLEGSGPPAPARVPEPQPPSPLLSPLPEVSPVPSVEAAEEPSLTLGDATPAEGDGSDFSVATPLDDQGGAGSPEVSQSLGEPETPLPEAVLEAPQSDFSDDGKTRVTTALRIAAKLIIPPGKANVTEIEMIRDEITIGRKRECDVVLSDKRASKKHLVIKKAGAQFILKDLGSTTGTLLNGERVTESEVAHGDRIQVGEVEMVFEAISSEYSERQADFLSVEPEVSTEQATGDLEFSSESPVALSGAAAQFDMGQPAFQLDGAAPLTAEGGEPLQEMPGLGTGSKKVDKGILARFRALDQKQQILVLAVGLPLLFWLLQDEEPEKKVAKKPKTVASAKPSPGPKTFETLSEAEKQLVAQKMAIAQSAYQTRQFDEAVEAARMVTLIIPDYMPATTLIALASAAAEKKRQAEAEAARIQREKEQQLRIEALVSETSVLMKKKAYPEAEEKFGEILSTDPENARVAEWKKVIAEERELKENQKREREQDIQIRKLMHERYLEAKALFDEKKYYEAIEASGRVDGKASDKDKKAAVALARAARKAIDDAREPLLKSAREAENSGEMSKAFALYQKATEADYLHREGYDAMSRIREILHEKGRKLYREGVLAEYFNDVPEAIAKFNEILSVVPKEDDYHFRALRKLAKYGQEPQRKPANSLELPATGSSDGAPPATTSSPEGGKP